MKTVDVQLKGTTLVDVMCDCGSPVWLGNNGYYCPKCDERIILNIIPEEKRSITLCEKALWTLQKTTPNRPRSESPFSRGYQLGFKEAKKNGIKEVEKVIEELKKDG